MGLCLQTVHTFKQNITGTNPETLSAGTSDSLQVPNFRDNTDAWLLDAWGGNSANACEFQIRSPDFHDNIRGIRVAQMFNPTLSGADGDPQLLMPYRVKQDLYATDTLIAEVTGTATNNVALDLLYYFADLPGADQQIYRWRELEPSIENYVSVRVSVTAGATGDYGTAVAFNATDARLEANRYYAILGAQSQLPCGLLTIKGFETSGRRIGLPLHWHQQISSGFFCDISERYNIPAVPVINANNAGNLLVEAADAATNVATAATFFCAELIPSWQPRI
jgi:hypothetical protein